jgi:hypothetical protein
MEGSGSVSVQIIKDSDPRGLKSYASKTLLTRYNHGSCAKFSLKGAVLEFSGLGGSLLLWS